MVTKLNSMAHSHFLMTSWKRKPCFEGGTQQQQGHLMTNTRGLDICLSLLDMLGVLLLQYESIQDETSYF